MSSQPINPETRINLLSSLLTQEDQQQLMKNALEETQGDWQKASEILKGILSENDLKKLDLGYTLAEWSGDNSSIVEQLVNNTEVNNLRDVALNFNVEKLTELVTPENIPETFISARTLTVASRPISLNTDSTEVIAEGAETPVNQDDEKKRNFAIALRQKLFTAEPTAVLQRMVEDTEIPIADTNIGAGIVNFLNNQPDFNIRTTSVYTAFNHPEAFKDIAEEHRPGVMEQLKTLQRTQALTPIPEALPVLMNANLTSAFHVAEMPESTFLRAYSANLGEETARQIYTNAINNRLRNEQALMMIRENMRGTGLAIIDAQQTMETRMARMRAMADERQVPIPLNLEQLFGDMDYCECDDCLSVYSPASYFVELLQYLRNNNLDSDSTNPEAIKPKTDPKNIKGTPLEKLFRRRPDLGCLELTCENTFTVLPYIDLVNEVMESFVVHLEKYKKDTNSPKQAYLDIFNVEDETTSELLAQPQHTNYEAYCILKSAVYPFTLPYHQPIDAIRIFLKYLGTSRYELLDIYRAADENCTKLSLTDAAQKELKEIHHTVLERAVDAEFLGITQEEYIILTKEAFWEKRYFEITLKKTPSVDQYQTNIGVKPIYEYYGYKNQGKMLSTDEAQQSGLTFVKKQFLPRTGIDYVDLVELLKTQFINPNYPQGQALTILESIRFSYKFLQDNYVNPDKNLPPKQRFTKLIEFLQKAQPLVPLLDARLHPNPCQQHKPNWCLKSKDLERWVYCYFEKIGQLIVLEAGEGLRLPIEGQLFTERFTEGFQPEFVGTLRKDGTIVDQNGQIIGNVTIDSKVVDVNKKPFIDQFGEDTWLQVRDLKSPNNPMGFVDSRSILVDKGREELVNWLPAQDTCDLDKVRLVHLDGSVLTVEEYDRLHRFIRLWRKLGWTIDETDKALVGLSVASTPVTNGQSPEDSEDCEVVGFDNFIDEDCSRKTQPEDDNCGCDDDDHEDPDQWHCPDIPQIKAEITPHFLHQLVAVCKLLDRTGLPLPKLLTFWADITTVGKKSLYSRLFLTHNLLGIDKVFKADADGNYLTQQPKPKITEHLPILMAVLNLKIDDITKLIAVAKKIDPLMSDDLTLHNVSVLYRHSLLAKILHIKISELEDAIKLFNSPLANAWSTLSLLEIWEKMENAGFTFRQLNYIIQDKDDQLRPIGPSNQAILQITKVLYDGLNAIERDHKDIDLPKEKKEKEETTAAQKEEIPDEKKQEATSELVRTKAGLFFESSVVEKIMGLLEGTTVYSTNAPLNLTITIPESQKSLTKKLKYSYQKEATPPKAGLQVTGILTDKEKAQAKALSTDPGWAKAIDRVGKQAQNILSDALSGIFPKSEKEKTDVNSTNHCPLTPEENELKNILLSGDDENSAAEKRFYFLKYFLPFLRKFLAHRFIVDTVAGATSLPSATTDVLLSDLLKIDSTKEPAINVLANIKVQPNQDSGVWQGFLIPPTDEAFTFVAISETKPQPLELENELIQFTVQQEDPSNVWSTESTSKKLKNGKLYSFKVNGLPMNQLQWKTATLSVATIPTSALLPDYTNGNESIELEILKKLSKASLVINGFNLSADEITYWQEHSAYFDQFNINKIGLQSWLRLEAYANLRNSLPKTENNLLDLFAWASGKADVKELSQQIADVTLWDKDNIEKLIRAKHFDLKHPQAFGNEINLIKLQKALVIADKIGVDIDSLFDWAKPGSKFWACHDIAEKIRKAIRARYDQEDWEQVVKPLNDELREHQKLALISYLLVQEELIKWAAPGVLDADSLFEFFLIDVQMDACMETSRIKQAISSVQLFIQRCFLGLEAKYDGVENHILDRDRWDWMQRYRVWEANLKVFCYPENLTEPTLRDDKSPFYKELESELLQKDINEQTVQDALKNYLFKVDEVANLKVVGLFLDTEGNKLHIFSRTRNAPYFFYYRYFDITEKNWYPWEKVQVDIPSYDWEEDGKITKNGTYLIPVVWNKRLLIFFPQFMKKTKSQSKQNEKSFQTIGSEPLSANQPIEYWEIKMGWSEYRNGKWTQKQLSAEAVYDDPNPTPPISTPPKELSNISSYEFLPSIVNVQEPKQEPKIVITVWNFSSSLGGFNLTGSQVFKSEALSFPVGNTVNFHYFDNDAKIYSLQSATSNPNIANPDLVGKAPYSNDQKVSLTIKVSDDSNELKFNHPFAHELLGKLTSGNLDDLFKYYHENVSISSTLAEDAYGQYNDDDPITDNSKLYDELKRPYSLYNWEVAFHAPMQLVDSLLKSNQFEQALKMCHYVFNPYAEGTGKERFWQFPPFQVVDTEDVLEKFFIGLQPNTSNDRINEWRNKPFQPHVIARSRPVAYMKWVVMKYIEILIAWGDYLFKQDTIETLNQATQLYVLAAHIYGPRGQKIPKRGKIEPQTYLSLLDKWDAFGNAMVELELAFPFSNQTPFGVGVSNGVVGFANIFGFATSLYFCIPDNPKLRALRDTIDDRLFKIRHCQNIEGVFRKLPLFEPPIDPALLVQAAAQGLSLASVLNDLNSPMPNYRFAYLVQKALELCGKLESMGSAFLSVKEKQDGEALSKLRAIHETTMQNLIMEVKKQQLEEAQKSVEALQQNRKGPYYRLQHYLKLIGEDLGKVPNKNTDFSELPDAIETLDEGGLKLIQSEKNEMEKASAAADWQIGIGTVETLASVFHALPNVNADGKPLGVGVTVRWGPGNLAQATQAVARGLKVYADNLSYQSTDAGRKGGFLRRAQEWVQQANVAGYEIKNIDKQILTQQIRINIANQEITNQQKQIDHLQEVEEFIKNKYTNIELYLWMEGQIKTLFYQTYTLAYEIAKKAEQVFRFERGLTTSNFIQFGYWDVAHDGLLAGEKLYVGLKQLESAYNEKRGHDYEITKQISLRQINPLALIELKETGTCEFALPEVLFDMDYPGHYMRRIKSVALTIPCVAGPYTSINSTLRLLEHKFRINAIAKDKNDYLEKTEETDERFSTVNVPIVAIATSSGQNDSGVFELNFKDERYMPFEGAGIISKWRLELPKEFRQFDYDTISDAIVHIRYTALEGGDKLKKPAAESVMAYIKSVEELSRDEGLFAAFDLKHDFPNEWYKAMNPPAGSTERVLMLNNLNERLPIFTKGKDPKQIQAIDVYLVTPTKLSASLMQDTEMIPFIDGSPVGETMKAFVIKDNNLPMNSWQLKIQDVKTKIDKLWLLVRYVLK